MLPCIFTETDHKWHLNVVRTKKGTRGAAKCIADVLTTFSYLQWSVIVNTHSNMESICFINIIKKQKTVNDDVIYASVLLYITSKNQ